MWYGTKKVAVYESDELKGLFKFVLALCKLIGVTEPPDKEIIVLLIDHIQEHHKDFSTEEIRRAFSLATAGKLNFEFNHYNRLTPQLISLTLNTYKSLRSIDILKYEHKLAAEEMEREREANKPSAKEILDMQISSCITYYKSYVKFRSEESSDEPIDWGNYSYLFLKELGLITHTKESREQIVKESRLELAKELHKRKRAVKISEIISDNESFEMKRMCRRISLNKYCENIYSNNSNIKDIIVNALKLSSEHND